MRYYGRDDDTMRNGGMQTHACISPHIFPAKPPPYFFT